MWRCKRCETDNADTDTLCNSCDWHAPDLINLEAILADEKDVPVYRLQWHCTHATSVYIDNDIGPVLPKGKAELLISKKTVLTFTCENEHTQKTFTKTLLLPTPVIDSFTAGGHIIKLGEPITLSWLTKYADKLLISELGEVTDATNADILLRKTSVVTLTAENETGKQTRSVSLTLPPPVILSFNAESHKVIEGDELALTWEISNAETLTLSGPDKDEIVSGTTQKIILQKDTLLTLTARNETGTHQKEISITVIPKPEISFLELNKVVVLANEEIEITWEAVNYSKLFLLFDENVIDVSERTDYKFNACKTGEIKLVCESPEKIKTISRSAGLKVIEPVVINSLSASSLCTVQSKPVLLTWIVSNATEIILYPLKKSIPPEGTISVSPDIKTTYVLEAMNELTSVQKEIQIDVLPLPRISDMRIPSFPEISMPNFYEYKMKYPPKTKAGNSLLEKIRTHLIQKFTVQNYTAPTASVISLILHSEKTGLKKIGLAEIINKLRSLSHIENISKLKKKAK